ncbi:MAG: RAD55 family ATPase [Candidatus Thorarchaeota archaeon]
MTLEEMLGKGRKFYQTGIKALDNEVPDGFPSNSSGVIRGPGGGGKSFLLNEIAKRQMDAGMKIIYVCFEDTPLSILQNLSSMGWDYKTMLKDEMIHIVDCFSSQILHKTTKLEHTTLVRDPTEPSEVSDAIHDLLNDGKKVESIGGIFVDSITELFLQSHPFKAVNAIKAWRATFSKDHHVPIWATYHTGLQQFAAYDDLITYSSDIIIDLRHEPTFKKAGALLKQFRVSKVKGARHNPMWVTFEVSPTGIEQMTMDEIRDLAKSITKFEEPGESKRVTKSEKPGESK